MNLSTFILDNIEPILQGWEDFARTLFPVKQKINTKELRDHAKKMLLVIALDLGSLQSNLEQAKKSKGLSSHLELVDTPAEDHGSERMLQGFSINDLAAEYRALRASVISLFGQSSRTIQTSDLQDLIRFSEAIDQSLSESIAQYTLAKEKQTRLFNSMLSASPDLNYILDLDGTFLYVNNAMSLIYKKPAHEILGKAIYNFEMPTVAEIREHIQYIIETGKRCQGEVIFKMPGGQEHFFDYVYAPVFDENGKIEAIAGTSRDITEQKKAEAQVWRNANYDSLTGLANRHRFLDKLDAMLKSSKRTETSIALLFIDLDKFKAVNDKLGHGAGDLLLKQVANRIVACVRNTDVVARMGGDEYVLILTDLHDVQHVELVAEKLLYQLTKPYRLKKNIAHISTSIGIAISPKDGVDPEVLLHYSDQAMYAAKQLGGNRFNFYRAVNGKAS